MTNEEQTAPSGQDTSTEPVSARRRRLVAGAAALITGLFVREATQAQPVAAAGNLIIDTANTGAGTTILTAAGNPGFLVQSGTPGGTALFGKNLARAGVGIGAQAQEGVAIQAGIVVGGPYSTPPIAVQGTTFASTPGAIAIQGNISQQTVGISSSAIEGGNYGSGDGRIGVLGVILPTPTNVQTSGITGLNQNPGVQAYGVFGECDFNTGVGVQGQSTNGVGVVGTSGTSYGTIGVTGGASYGIYGLASANNSAAFAGGNNNPNGFAAVFGGRVQINGPLVVTGAKSAAVPHPDGSQRLVYCVEAPESWFEDFGEGKLVAGRAEVKLDPDFAAVVDTSKMHVFLTPHDETHHIAVKARGGGGFSVAADVVGTAAARGVRGGDLSGTFSYRIVAKRKDVAGTRFAKYKAHDLKLEDPTTHKDWPLAKDRFKSPEPPKQ